MSTTTSLLRQLNDLKTPKGGFLSGNLKDFKKKNKHRILEGWTNQYGEFYTIKLGPAQILVSSNPEVNNEILKKRPKEFRRLSKIDDVFKEMGFHTVFNAEGEDWKKQRKPVTEALNVKKVRGYYPIIQEKTQQLLTKINHYNTNQITASILNNFTAFTIDVTTEIAFGHKLNTINNKKDSFQNHLEIIFPMINQRITAALPLWRIFPSKKDRTLKKSLEAIEITIGEFISKAKERLSQSSELRENPSNFLEALLVESKMEASVFNEKTLYGNVIAMLLAGEDTTSNTLAWTLFYLAQHPEMVSKIRAESIKNYSESVPDSYVQIQELKYTNAVIQEAIRLKPTSPLLYFQANENVIIKDLNIPKDTKIILQNGYAAMQDNYFTDAKTFAPERWLATKCPYHKNHSPKTVKAFGGGTRLCPGMHLSMIEMTTVISSICKQFDIELAVSPNEVVENFAFTVHPENLKVNFKKVSK